MFSKRLPWDESGNALARLAAERIRAGDQFIDLTESNPTRVELAYPTAEILAALTHPDAGRYDPAPLGLPAARAAVAGDYARRGARVSPEAVVLTASSSESYGMLLKLLCDPGDAVLVPEPSYPLFDYLARLDGVEPRHYRLEPDWGWRIDFASLAAAAAAGRLRAVVAVAPNNPTGSCLTAAELDRLGAFCVEHDAALVVDEVFADYRTPGRIAGGCDRAAAVLAHETAALTFSLGGLSKSCGLPQLKLGWIAVGGPRGAAEAALTRLELIADTYLSVAAPVQLALPRLFELGAGIRRQIRDRVAANRAILAGAVGPASPCTLLPSEGGWSAILRVPAVRSDEAWALTLLREDGVLVHPGYLFDMPARAYLVPSLLSAPPQFGDGIGRLLARCVRDSA